MAHDKDRARAQLFRLAYIVRNIAYYRSLAVYCDSLDQNFWIFAFNNFFDMSVLEWCKVFGSRGESTHWAGVVRDEEAFRSDMLMELKLTHNEWVSYWKEMKHYRDFSVAHHTKDPRFTKYPRLDTALRSTFFLYGHLVNQLKDAPEPVYFLPKDLSRYYERLLSHAGQVSAAAYEASRGIEDKVK